MGKPFEITYTAPYAGIHTQLPESIVPQQYSPNLDNVILRNGEIRSRPALRYLYNAPSGVVVLGITSFLTNTGGLHTVLMTTGGLYEIEPLSFVGNKVLNPSPWSAVIPGTQFNPTPVSYWVSRGVIYMTQGTDPSLGIAHVSAWDGLASSAITDVAFTGASATSSSYYYGGYFIGSMADQLIIAFTVEGSPASPPYNIFPQRIRWSSTPWNPWGTSNPPAGFGSGLGTQGATFDPTINLTAGQLDITDTSDWITGMMLMGQVGYIFRQCGISQMSPTGNGSAPFQFDHLWASKNGVGSVQFYTIAQYGSTGVFCSTEQIYQISPSTFNVIGGGCRDLIMADLALASSTPSAIITPALNLGFTYLTYQLYIPMVDSSGQYVRVYVYSLEDQNWMRWTMRGATNVSVPGIAWV